MERDRYTGISPHILDGALGTELERHGVDTSGKSWSARSLVTDPELVGRLHREYLRAGATVITANTFRTNPRALRDTGLDPEKLTRKAVCIAREASDGYGAGFVAGSMAPVEDCYSPQLVPSSDPDLLREHAIMARWLIEAGVDIILIETMNTLREALAALRAASVAGAKKIWVSIVPKDARTMLDGTSIEEAVWRIKSAGADLVALNCAPVSVLRGALGAFSRVASEAGIRFGCYPNASELREDGSWDLEASGDDEIAKCAEEWLVAGAALVGSCCHSTPATTAALSAVRAGYLARHSALPKAGTLHP